MNTSMTITLELLPPTAEPSDDPDAPCPSCGSRGGDGYTFHCFDAEGCGYFKLLMTEEHFDEYAGPLKGLENSTERLLFILVSSGQLEPGRYTTTVVARPSKEMLS